MTRRQALLCCGAAAAGSTPPLRAQDAVFVSLANDYIAKLLEHQPEIATDLGEHRYDDRLTDYSKAGRAAWLAINRDALAKLDAIAADKLDLQNRIDARILRNQLEGEIWSLTVLREHEWNPMTYNPGGSLYYLLERDFAPLNQRLESVRKRLEAIPRLLEQGRENLSSATKIHTETAILQNKGAIGLVRGEVERYAGKSLAPAQAKAAGALEAWGQWLEKELLPRATRDFRIGPELYRTKLRYTLDSALAPDEIRQRAERDLRDTHEELYTVALPLYQRHFPGKPTPDRKAVIRAVLDKLAESRPQAATILDQAKRELKDATEFVRSKQIVTVPDEPVQIVEMPEFQRGVAVASCASPGPLEKNGKTFYNISPPPSDWSDQQVASYFREYNDYMVKDLTVHEAMPGHYLQIAHSNRFKAPTLVRAIFGSGSFVEGWAVYAEKAMVENGYGGPEVRMQQLKMRLRLIINALIDQGIHARGMTEQQAMDLMMNDGFQEKSEAAGKYRRAMLTSTQLSTYYVGSTELFQLRDDYQKRFGAVKNWKAFHDKLLSFGSPAPKYVRELMGV